MADTAEERVFADIAAAVRDRESFAGTVTGSAIGGAIAAALFYAFGSAGTIPVLFLVLPSLAVAYSARFMGHPIGMWCRTIPGAVAGVVHLFGSLFLFPSPFAIGLIPVSFILAAYLSKTKLTRDEARATSYCS
jgi:hypothetical protein